MFLLKMCSWIFRTDVLKATPGFFLGVLMKISPRFIHNIYSPGKKEQIFQKDPPAAALVSFFFDFFIILNIDHSDR